MRLAIVGSRNFNDYNKLVKTVKEQVNLSEVEEIISGGATGADSLAAKMAEEYGIPLTEILPKWHIYGKRAGFIRNELIINAADFVIAFWDGASRGTLDSINHTKRQGKKLHIQYF